MTPPTMLIDSHCHLTDPRLEPIDQTLARAKAAGVARAITIGVDPTDAERAVALCRRFPEQLRCAVGVHPNHSHEVTPDAVDRIAAMLADSRVVALGEIGLDYFHQFAPRDVQRSCFERQLAIALEAKKPVVLHAREAIGDTLAVLANFPGTRAVFHSFTGTPSEAEAIVAAGFYVGFTGPVTYKKNDALREAARLVPLDRLLVETDSPYLSPEPVRSQRTNEPANVAHIARRIAEVKGVTFEMFARATTRNVEALFGW